MAEGIGVLDGECEGWAVYQEWGGVGWVMIVRCETQILNNLSLFFARPQARMVQVNDWHGEEVVRFKPYDIPVGALSLFAVTISLNPSAENN